MFAKVIDTSPKFYVVPSASLKVKVTDLGFLC